ncbi:TraR/DksA family transcriptional regulator [Flexivirga meconopsidis]|uniref:TraR/DksA family transcriptional regulator n=1 Tax=Flexivirga meconopsidis TaxID=2977121 RepID=UPI002240DCC9|nr:TraR/DksA C4-type zinc finger protein [Flexivirga meconopsidis]
MATKRSADAGSGASGRRTRVTAALRKAAGKAVSKATSRTGTKAAPAKKSTAKAPAKKAAAKKAAAAKTPAKTTAKKAATAKTAVKASAKKSAAKKTPAKQTVVPKTPPKKSAATKAPAKKTVGTKAPAKKAVAKKSSPKTSSARKSSAAPAAKAPAKKTVAKKATAAKATPTKVNATKLKVRDDESPWTAKELSAVRAELQGDVERLTTELHGFEDDIAGLIKDSGDGAGDDQADAGAKTFEREHEYSLAQNSRDLLEQSVHALERIDDGSYGLCENCGNPIGKLRLQAFPRATLCLTCKQQQERR